MALSQNGRGHVVLILEDFEVVALPPFTRRTISSELAEFIARHARRTRLNGDWRDRDHHATTGANTGAVPAGTHSWDHSQAPA